jgi:hypothetical protein
MSILASRDVTSLSPLTFDLLIALLAVSLAGLISIGALWAIRKYNTPSSPLLPTSNRTSKHSRGLTIHTPPYSRDSSIYVYDEKSPIVSSASSSPTSPVPEIRITFPDECDEQGRTMSGRVVVVRVGDKSIGLEPLDEEQLPKYEKAGWSEIDMEKIGGLKERA